MNKISFIIKRVFDMNYKDMLASVSRMHKRSGKNRVGLFVDMIYCGWKYGAGYRDYEYFEFWLMNRAERSTYVTRTANNLIMAKLNKKEYYHCLNDKVDFNTKYNEFLKRDWLDFRTATKEDFLKFIDGKEAIIVKPIDACCGVGVEKWKTADFENYDQMYQRLTETPSAQLLEDYVRQHPDMMMLYPHSVNTVRVTTVLKDNTVHILYAALRIGNNGKVVDNVNNGGMSAPVDLDTGVVTMDAVDKENIIYEKHPMTGTSIKGFAVPYWKETLELCKKAALVTPQIRYCGWDVAICTDGPLFIEANQLPSYELFQIPPSRLEKKCGILPRMKEILGDEVAWK